MSYILCEAMIWNTLLLLDLPDTLGVFAKIISIVSVSPIPAWTLVIIGSEKKSVVSNITAPQPLSVMLWLQIFQKGFS